MLSIRATVTPRSSDGLQNWGFGADGQSRQGHLGHSVYGGMAHNDVKVFSWATVFRRGSVRSFNAVENITET